MDPCTENSLGCNHCPEAIADTTGLYTEGQQAEIHKSTSLKTQNNSKAETKANINWTTRELYKYEPTFNMLLMAS